MRLELFNRTNAVVDLQRRNNSIQNLYLAKEFCKNGEKSRAKDSLMIYPFNNKITKTKQKPP